MTGRLFQKMEKPTSCIQYTYGAFLVALFLINCEEFAKFYIVKIKASETPSICIPIIHITQKWILIWQDATKIQFNIGTAY